MSVAAIPPDTPAGIPPYGAKVDMKNPPSTGPIMVGLSSALLGLMWCFVAARAYVKTRINKKVTADDVTCVIGALFVTCYYGVTTYSGLHCATGVHQWNITLGQLLARDCIIDSYLSLILAAPTLLFIKITFFIFYQHLFRPFRFLRVANWIGGSVTVLGYTAFFIASMIYGTPRGGESWLVHYSGAWQSKAAGISIPLPAFGLALDLVILAIPLVGIFNLQLPTRRKIGVGLIFLTGIVAVIASILAITYRIHIQHHVRDDLTYNLMPAFTTSMIEMTLGICITCMPAFSHMLRHTLPPFETLRSRLSSRFSRSKGSGHGSNWEAVSDKDRSASASSNNAPVGLMTYEMGSLKTPVKTYIGKGNGRDMREEDGVHLKHDLHQEYQHASVYSLPADRAKHERNKGESPAIEHHIV